MAYLSEYLIIQVPLSFLPSPANSNVLKSLSKALKPVNEFLEGKDYLIGDFSAADCMLGHSCFMSSKFGTVSDEMQNIKRYISNIESRPAFQKAITLGAGGPGDALG